MTNMDCPRCQTSLVPRFGQLHEAVCPQCDGRFVDGDAAGRVFDTIIGVTPGMLEELAALFGGERLACPGCQAQMRPMQLSSVPVDVCLLCGGLWCDQGELSRLSSGRIEEVSAHAETGAAEQPAPAGAAAIAATGTEVLYADDNSPALAIADDRRSTFALYCAEGPAVSEAIMHRAFTESGVLTAFDAAQRKGRDRGVLATHLKRDPAHRLARTFADLGVPCAVVDRARYRPPAPRAVRSLQLKGGTLSYLDQYNRRVDLSTTDIAVVGASETVHEETKHSRLVETPLRYAASALGGVYASHAPEYQRPDGTRSRTPSSTTRSIETLRIDIMLRNEAVRLAAVNEQLFVAKNANARERVADVGRLLQALTASNSAIRLSTNAKHASSRLTLERERAGLYEEELEWLYWRALRS